MSGARKSRAEPLRQLVQDYIAAVLGGTRVVGKLERQAVERHVRDLALLEAGERPHLRFDEEDALHVLRFAERYVHHTKGEWAGRRFRFTPESAWMAFILWSLFGWKRHHSPSGRSSTSCASGISTPLPLGSQPGIPGNRSGVEPRGIAEATGGATLAAS